MQTRVPLGAISLALVALGTFAVFESDNEVGTATLLVSGLFIGTVAMFGRLPTKVKFGDAEIILEEVVRAANEGGEEASEALLRVALERTQAARKSGDRRLSATEYEYAVLQALTTEGDTETRVSLEQVPGEGVVDAIFTRNNRSVAVEMRAGTEFRVRDLVPRFMVAKGSDVLDVDAFVIVVQADRGDPAITARRSELSSFDLKIWLVTWRPTEPVSGLRHLLDQLLAAEEPPVDSENT